MNYNKNKEGIRKEGGSTSRRKKRQVCPGCKNARSAPQLPDIKKALPVPGSKLMYLVMVKGVGLEPTTYGLKGRCSTD